MTAPLVALGFFLLLQFGIGVWVSRRIGTEEDYLVGGRRFGYLLATISIFATWFGAESVIGSAGQVYENGLSLSSAEPFGYGLCLVLVGLLLAKPLWTRGLTTLADLYRTRFGVGVERLVAILLIPPSVLWAAAQIRAFGSVVALVGNIDVSVGIAVAALFVVAYTAFGGLLADAITDVVQGAVLTVGLLTMLTLVVMRIGGPGEAAAALMASDRISLSFASAGPWYLTLEEWAVPMLGSLVSIEVLGRVLAARSGEVAQRSAFGAGGLYLIIGAIPAVIALLASPLVGPLADAEQLLPTVARDLLPPLAFALFTGGLVSAILSTVDSTLLASSGLLSHNLIIPNLRTADERTKLRIARGGVMAFGMIAFAIALSAEGVFVLVELASSLGSAGVVVTTLFALFTTLGSARTAAATLVMGLVGYLAASLAGVETPFLLSLLVALITWGIGCLIDAAAS